MMLIEYGFGQSLDFLIIFNDGCFCHHSLFSVLFRVDATVRIRFQQGIENIAATGLPETKKAARGGGFANRTERMESIGCAQRKKSLVSR